MAESWRKDKPERPTGSSLPEGDDGLSSALYAELHKMAVHRMRFERVDHTLQPTALVHEAYLRLAEVSGSAWRDREHFLAVAARIMRHILVDHARSHDAGKRGAGAIQVEFDENLLSEKRPGINVLIIDEALTRLSALDARQAEILELHFFAGMTFEEIGAVLGISCRTVKRDWSMARAWMRVELSRRK